MGKISKAISAGLSMFQLRKATADASKVLEGSTFYAGSKELKKGTMPNKAGWTGSVVPGGTKAIPEGYHDGTSNITAPAIKTVEVWQTMGAGAHYYTFTGGTLVGVTYAGNPYSGDNSLQGAGIRGTSEYWAQTAWMEGNVSIKFVLAYY